MTTFLQASLTKYLEANTRCHPPKSWIEQKAVWASAIPLSFFASLFDGIAALFAKVATYATLGKIQATKNFSRKHFYSADQLLARPYYFFLRVLNKDLTIGDYNPLYMRIVNYVPKKLRSLANNASESENWATRHVASRLDYALAAVATAISLVAHGALAALGVALSILTLARVRRINAMAYDHLSCLTAAIGSTWTCLERVVVPFTPRPAHDY